MAHTRDGIAYAGGSETSYEAAIRARKFVSQQGMEVFAWLKSCGPHGGTRKELEAAIGIKTPSACARLKALEDAGAIRKTTEKRDGCAAYIVIGRVQQQMGMF